MTRLHGGLARTRVLGGVALLGFVWLLSGALAGKSLVSRPRSPYAEPLPDGLAAEEVVLTTRDGERLGAWLHARESGRPFVILLHGSGGSRSTQLSAARHFAERGVGFLAVTLRSFGDSSGNDLDFGWSSRADVLAAVQLVAERAPGVRPVVIGQSLGAVAAIYAAEELGASVAGYVLEAPYRDLDKACGDRLRAHLTPALAGLAHAALRLWAPAFLPVALDRLRPVEHVARFQAELPVLFVAGAFDLQAPVEDVRLLSERCTGAAELVVLDGRDHVELARLDERHLALWDDFLERIERVPSASF